jgi:hypothetical protein
MDLHSLQFTTAHTSVSSASCLHQSSGKGFQEPTFPFLSYFELSPCISHSDTPQHPIIPERAHSRGNLNVSSQIKLKLTLSEVKVKIIYHLRSVGQYTLVSGIHLGPATNFSSFCYYLLCGAPSLTRGRVCSLQCNQSMVRVAQNP